MAKATQGKRTANKTAMKRAPAGRRRLKMKSDAAFPGGNHKTRQEVERMVPRVTRS